MKGNEKPKAQKKQIVEIIDSSDNERLYSNYISVTTGPHECNLTFCHIDPSNVTTAKIKAKVVSKVMIPNSLVEDVLVAIENNYKNALKRLTKSKK